MDGFLAYSSPKRGIFISSGIWQKAVFQQLPKNHFFITDFQKKDTFVFHPSKHEISTNNPFPSNIIWPGLVSKAHTTAKEEYLTDLQNFINDFEKSNIKKAVFSRIKFVASEKDLKVIFEYLVHHFKTKALVYLVSSSTFGTWIGATPEILVAGDLNALHTMSLAGTKSIATIAWTEKEIEEQQIVTDFIAQQLTLHQSKKVEQSKCYTFHSGTVFHLRTDFTFQLPSEQWNDLIATLHPTPAVGGIPIEKAIPHILSYERHQRKFYTGLLGWFGQDEIEVYVNLRCMEYTVGGFLLYLGGGITTSSNCGHEWTETENKAQTLLGSLK